MKTLAFLLLALSFSAMNAQPDHGLLSQVLAKHVREGRVDYAGIRKDSRFTRYIAVLSETRASELRGADAVAFWINAYNAFTIKIVCDNYPIRSLRDIAQGKIWERPMLTVGGEQYSLKAIVDDKLRPLSDGRIHAALVSASMGCAPLRSEAYFAATLDEQLNQQMTAFVRNTAHNTFSVETKTARVSRIFEWYQVDFGATYPAMLKTIARYMQEDVRSELLATANEWKVEFADFDWSLNGK